MADDDATAADAAYTFSGTWDGQVIATAIHTGHDLRAETAAAMVLPEDVRLREEDPFTDRIGEQCPARVVVHRSRFEVDLNRDRDGAVYRTPDDCWGLEVWRDDPLPQEIVDGSLEVYDAFYRELGERLDEVAARGPFVVFDVHSYNHRRDGATEPEAAHEENPEVNVGTGSLDRGRWSHVVDALMDSLAEQHIEGRPLDVRENVRFRGANLARWVHERYPGTGVALALEFKKTFMDEWTGVEDASRIEALASALAATIGPVTEALKQSEGGGAPR
jgi:N-formylglutamate deformylase